MCHGREKAAKGARRGSAGCVAMQHGGTTKKVRAEQRVLLFRRRNPQCFFTSGVIALLAEFFLERERARSMRCGCRGCRGSEKPTTRIFSSRLFSMKRPLESCGEGGA